VAAGRGRGRSRAQAQRPAVELDGEVCAAARDSFRGFLTQTKIQPEQLSDGAGLVPLRPSTTQESTLAALASAPCGEAGDWVIVNKPRQSMISTLCAAWMLRELEYTPGANGAIICDKDSTTQELFERVKLMHESQPPQMRVPQTRMSTKGMAFSHGGRWKALTAKGQNPAIGFSIDRLMCSEFGFWRNAARVSSLLFPTLLKRRHARVVIESTPSQHGSHYQKVWYAALEGRSRFRPIFIPWWQHASYQRTPPPGWRPDATLDGLLTMYPGITVEHLWFMRSALDTVFDGNEALFRNSYPFDPFDGWLSSQQPALPPDPLRVLELSALADPPMGEGFGGEKPQLGVKYYIFADPNGYGAAGDPSAYTVWDLYGRREAASWSGRVDPSLFGRRLVEIARRWNEAVLVIESNAAACVATAVATGYRHIWGESIHHPGWYTTRDSKQRSIAALTRLLQDQDIAIRSRMGLLQLLAWDGTSKRVTEDGESHHWDRCQTYFMAADLLDRLKPPPLPAPRAPLPIGSVRVADLERFRARPAPPSL